MAQKRADGTPLGCEACHSTKSWIEIRNFDHSKTKFPLTGSHRGVACDECHKALPGTHEIQFKGTPKNCEACHTDPHAAQFAAKDGVTKCADCHVDQRWAPSTFDHDKRTQFPLTGAHANVACAMCHGWSATLRASRCCFTNPLQRTAWTATGPTSSRYKT